MGDPILLKNFQTRRGAELAKEILESKGIKVLLQFDEVGDVLLGGLGVENGSTNLFVLKENLKEAQEILEAYQNN